MRLDDFERDILESVENDEWISKGNIEGRKEELKSYLKKKKAISIRVNEADIYKINNTIKQNNILLFYKKKGMQWIYLVL